MSSTLTELQQKQIEQAEELLFSGPEKAGFCKDLYFGKFRSEAMLPFPRQSPDAQAAGDAAVAAVREFCETSIDAAQIDRDGDIPQSVIDGLGQLGVLGMAVDPQFGGRGFSQQNYCRVMEVIGGHCGSTAVFVNAHHSIGCRGLELFGSPEQKARWMRPLTTGEQLAAFALTEPAAGSDASNVQTRAVPTEDGTGFLLSGEKRYITNGAIAQLLTVMARTPDPDKPDGVISAFLVTPDMPGFEVVEARMPKCGIKGTATARLAFHDMFVPKENLLGEQGKGLKIALTVLDFGRTTFGAGCTGAAKFCVERLVAYANERRQFGKTLGEFELVQQKIAEAAADTYAMESATYHTAALIDSGAHDYMLETAMLKVFASDQLWRIVNDTLQVFGGAGYFSDQPFERMMRDARINLIGEGANDVLRSFIAMVGLRGLGLQLQGVANAPWKVASLWRPTPSIPVTHPVLEPAAKRLARQIGRFARACRNSLIRYREAMLDAQLVQARIGDTATELFMAGAVYSRLSSLLDNLEIDEETRARELQTGLYAMKLAHRRNEQRLNALHDNDDPDTVQTAKTWLNSGTG